MGRTLPDKIPSRISISFSPLNILDMNKCIQEKEFKTVEDLVNTAIRFYFENKNRPSSKDDFKAWLLSKEGENYMKGIIRQVMEE